MGRKTQTFEIDGGTYRITQLGAVEALTTTVQLAKTLAPLLKVWNMAGVKKADGQSWTDALLSSEGGPLFRSAAAFLEALDEDTILSLATKFGRVTEVRTEDKSKASKGRTDAVRWPKLVSDGDSAAMAVFDEHFAGRVPTILRWLAVCISFNGGSFLAGFRTTSGDESEAHEPAAEAESA